MKETLAEDGGDFCLKADAEKHDSPVEQQVFTLEKRFKDWKAVEFRWVVFKTKLGANELIQQV